MRTATLLASAALAASMVASSAFADNYRFNVHDPTASIGGQSAQNYYFEINTADAPASYDSGSVSFNVTDYTMTFSADRVMDMVTFYTYDNFGGFQNTLTTTFEQGPQAFGGATNMPAFSNATYFYDTDQPNGGESLTITDLDASVSSAPEPASWALMMLGVGFIGWALVYRERVLVDHKAKLAAIG